MFRSISGWLARLVSYWRLRLPFYDPLRRMRRSGL